MKIRNPALIRALSWVGARLIQTWVGTVRYQYRPLGPNFDPNRRGFAGRFIYAFWHENMLLPAYHYARPDIHVLISEHADGQLISHVCRRLGFGTVHGSTTRGGRKAVRQMLRIGETGHLAFTPDGPRGPRRQVQPGLVYLASRTGLPVVPFGIGWGRAWRAGSWDRFAVPYPFSRGYCVTTHPIAVPPALGTDALEPYRLQVQSALDAAQSVAERWAATRRFDPSGYEAPPAQAKAS